MSSDAQPQPGAAARAYHQATNHSLESVRANTHRMVWKNQPRPFKLYVDTKAVPLPSPADDSTIPALQALRGAEHSRMASSVLPDHVLASILHYSAGITRTLKLTGGEMRFRAAACTGALYHNEIYVATAELGSIPAGIYQYSAQDEGLRLIRSGDHRAALVSATAAEPSAAQAPTLLIYTTTFWRNSWKYQARAYRHAFWDGGTMLANTLALAWAHQVAARLILGFADDAVNTLLDLDDEREVAIGILSLGTAAAAPPASLHPLTRLGLATVPYSPYEVPEPLIRQVHDASNLATPAEVGAWRASALTRVTRPLPSEPLQLAQVPDPTETIEAVIRRRGSARRFARTPISAEALSSILTSATQGVPADVLREGGPTTSTLYLIIHAVEGVETGTYVYDADRQALQLLQRGEFRDDAGYLDLGQELAADSAVNCYVLADLDAALAAWGDRGYRVAQLEGGIIGGRLYLASYALGLSATGLTFFDDDVIRFFSPHAQGKSVMFLTAIGNRAPRR